MILNVWLERHNCVCVYACTYSPRHNGQLNFIISFQSIRNYKCSFSLRCSSQVLSHRMQINFDTPWHCLFFFFGILYLAISLFLLRYTRKSQLQHVFVECLQFRFWAWPSWTVEFEKHAAKRIDILCYNVVYRVYCFTKSKRRKMSHTQKPQSVHLRVHQSHSLELN